MLKIKNILILCLAVSHNYLYADKEPFGSPLVFTGVHWQSNLINLNKIRDQMASVPMLVVENTDTCFTRRVASNQAVLSTICNHTVAQGEQEMYAIKASVRLCVPDTLVTFATFNEYLFEQLDWLADIDAIQLTSVQNEDLIAESKIRADQTGAYYFVDSLQFFNAIGGGGCPYNPGNLPLPVVKTPKAQNGVERIASNSRLAWRGLSESAKYSVVLQDVSGRQLATQNIRTHNGQLEWTGAIPAKPYIATIQSEDGAVMWSAIVP